MLTVNGSYLSIQYMEHGVPEVNSGSSSFFDIYKRYLPLSYAIALLCQSSKTPRLKALIKTLYYFSLSIAVLIAFSHDRLPRRYWGYTIKNNRRTNQMAVEQRRGLYWANDISNVISELKVKLFADHTIIFLALQCHYIFCEPTYDTTQNMFYTIYFLEIIINNMRWVFIKMIKVLDKTIKTIWTSHFHCWVLTVYSDLYLR